MIERMYNRVMLFADHPHSRWILGMLSFLESSISPIPPDILLVPMCLKNRSSAWYLAVLCGGASILGGILGYFIGYFLFESLGLSIFQTYGLMPAFENFKTLFNEWGFWIIVIKGLTPIPFKVVTIASGMTGLDFPTFVFASAISRMPRFLIEAGLLWYFGAPMQRFIEKNLRLVFYGFGFVVIGGMIAVKYLR